jgi:hypothetical protein
LLKLLPRHNPRTQSTSLEFPDLKYQVVDLFSVLSSVTYAFGRAVKKQSNAPNIWLGTESGHFLLLRAEEDSTCTALSFLSP